MTRRTLFAAEELVDGEYYWVLAPSHWGLRWQVMLRYGWWQVCGEDVGIEDSEVRALGPRLVPPTVPSGEK